MKTPFFHGLVFFVEIVPILLKFVKHELFQAIWDENALNLSFILVTIQLLWRYKLKFKRFTPLNRCNSPLHQNVLKSFLFSLLYTRKITLWYYDTIWNILSWSVEWNLINAHFHKIHMCKVMIITSLFLCYYTERKSYPQCIRLQAC